MEQTDTWEQGQRESASARTTRIVGGVVFVTFFVGLVVALHAYIGSRLIDGAGLSGLAAGAAWTVIWLLFVSIPAGFMATRALPRRLAVPLYWISHLWMGLFGLLLTVVAATDVARLIVTWVAGAQTLGALTLSQVQALVIVALVVPAAIGGYRVARGQAKVERLRIPMTKVGAGLDGLRIVQLSDVHIGETLDRKFLERVVARTNGLDPDVVVITGDLVDGSPRRLREEIAPLGQLRARHGVYYVTGNHEYYHGGPAWEDEVRRLGLTVLHNSHVVIERGGEKLVIAGVPDPEARHFGSVPDVDRALAGAPAGAPRVLLAHQPRQARLAEGRGVDLQLSGHTHGGQLFPFMFFVRLQQPVVSGLHTLYGTRVYTHRGTGYWGPPLRIGPAPEIAEITLTRA